MANEFKIRKGLIVEGASGGTVVDIQGSQGQLFSVTDDLSGSIFAVSDISGVPILDVNSSGLSTFDGNLSISEFIYHTGDTGTNIQMASGQLILKNSGGKYINLHSNNIMYFDASAYQFYSGNATFVGDVGIGTTSPGAPLSFANSVGNKIDFYHNTGGTSGDRYGIEVQPSELRIYSGAEGDSTGGITFGKKTTSTFTEAMRIRNDGNVGIGTTSPAAKLHVVDDTNFTSGQASVEVLKLQRKNTGGDIKATTEGHISMWATDSNNDTEWGRISWVNDNAQDGGLETEGAMSFSTSNAGTLTRAMYIDHDQQVGVGTTSPGAKLDVTGNIQSTNQIRAKGWYTSGSGLALETGISGGVGYVLSYDRTAGSYASTVIESTGVKFTTHSSGKFYFTGGNVGIGTTNPGANLYVSGGNADATDKPTMISESVFTIKPVELNSGNLNFAQVDGGNSIGMQYTNGAGTANWDISMQPFGGNVGIGTTSPGEKLDVSGNIRGNNFYANDSTVPTLYMERGDGLPQPVIQLVKSNDNLIIGHTAIDEVIFYDDAGEAMRLDGGGNLGIGTTSPLAKLQVGLSTSNAGSDVAMFGGAESGILSALSLVNTLGNSVAGYGTALDFHVNSAYSPTGRIATIAESTGTPAALAFYTYNDGLNEKMRINSVGTLTLSSYGAGILKTNSSGTVGLASSGDLPGGPYLPLTGGTLTDDLTLNDNVELRLGSDADLRMFHNGSHGYIQGYTGNIYLRTFDDGADLIFQADNGSGGVSTYLTLDGSTTDIYFTNPGNVGIGTTNPNTQLEIGAATNVAPKLRLTLNDSGSSIGAGQEYGGIQWKGNDGQGDGVRADIRVFGEGTSGEAYMTFGTMPAGTSASTNAQERMRIDSSGNVGIGTTGMYARFNVRATSHNNGISVNRAADNTAAIYIGNDGGSNPVLAANNANMIFGSDFSGTFTEHMRLEAAGNVGIGTTNPDSKLDVKGPSAAPADGAQTLSITNITGGTQLNLGTAENTYGWIEAREGGTLRNLLLNPNGGNVGIGTTSPVAVVDITKTTPQTETFTPYLQLSQRGTVANSKTGISFRNTQYVWDMGKIATERQGSTNSFDMVFYTANAGTDGEGLRIDHSGNIGIGTSTPNAKLDIQGTQGQLFSVTDDLSGDIFSVADISGVPIMNVNSDGTSYFDGNVGIGTASPGAKLEISEASSGSQYEALRLTNTADSGNMGAYISWKDSYATDQMRIVSQRDGAGNGSILTFNQRISGALSPALVLKNGNVGIGTTTPLAKLDIEGQIQIGGASATPNIAYGMFAYNGIGLGIYSVAGGANQGIGFWLNNGSAYEAGRWLSGGNLGIGTTSPGYKLDVNNTTNENIARFYRSSSATSISHLVSTGRPQTRYSYDGQQAWYVGNNLGAFGIGKGYLASTIPVLNITSTERVGIGTATPDQKLQVDGNIRIPNSGKIVFGTPGTTPDDYLQLNDIIATGSLLKLVQDNNTRFVVQGVTGNVGIGETNPTSGIHVNLSQQAARFISSQATGLEVQGGGNSQPIAIFKNTAASAKVTITSTGELVVVGNVTASNFILSSDKRLKDNIKEINTNYLDVSWKNFELKSEPGVKRAGVIAQELEKTNPEFVRTNKEGLKSVAYIDLLITKIAELEARLEKLEK